MWIEIGREDWAKYRAERKEELQMIFDTVVACVSVFKE